METRDEDLTILSKASDAGEVQSSPSRINYRHSQGRKVWRISCLLVSLPILVILFLYVQKTRDRHQFWETFEHLRSSKGSLRIQASLPRPLANRSQGEDLWERLSSPEWIQNEQRADVLKCRQLADAFPKRKRDTILQATSKYLEVSDNVQQNRWAFRAMEDHADMRILSKALDRLCDELERIR